MNDVVGRSKAAMNAIGRQLAVEEPSITTIILRPGVVDTDMQATIRSDASMGAMKEEQRGFFKTLKEDGNLVPVDVAGRVLCALVLKAEKTFSGRFVSWDDVDIKALWE